MFMVNNKLGKSFKDNYVQGNTCSAELLSVTVTNRYLSIQSKTSLAELVFWYCYIWNCQYKQRLRTDFWYCYIRSCQYKQRLLQQNFYLLLLHTVLLIQAKTSLAELLSVTVTYGIVNTSKDFCYIQYCQYKQRLL